MTTKRKELIHTLLKGIETGDAESVKVVNPDQYIQHNPSTYEGGEGLASLFKRLSKTCPRVNLVRLFSDGDYVFAHTEYDFSTQKIGFEIFRFEGEQTVEHWDNIQARKGPNFAGHTMVDGAIKVCDLEQSEFNRQRASTFVEDVLINKQFEKLDHYIDSQSYTEHHPILPDALTAKWSAFAEFTGGGGIKLSYTKLHRVLAEGNFVLCVAEGYVDGVHSSFYDLFRLADGKIVEHWDTTEAIPPQSEWKNNNGKF